MGHFSTFSCSLASAWARSRACGGMNSISASEPPRAVRPLKTGGHCPRRVGAPARADENGRRHVVPLSGPAANILAALPLLGEFVFSFGDRPVRGFSKVKRRLDALSGVTGWRNP